MPASAPSPTTSQRAASSAPPAGGLPPAGGITCPSPQKTPTTRREILVALGVPPAPVGVPPTARPPHPSASRPSTLSTLRRATENGRSIATEDGCFVRSQKYPACPNKAHDPSQPVT